jgi:hypothetical protein
MVYDGDKITLGLLKKTLLLAHKLTKTPSFQKLTSTVEFNLLGMINDQNISKAELQAFDALQKLVHGAYDVKEILIKHEMIKRNTSRTR